MSEAAAPSVVVEGKVRSGNTPVPGATVTATNTKTGQKINTWTQTDGSYKLSLSSGDYSVRVQMVAFAATTQQVHVSAGNAHHQIDFHITLLSRAETAGAGAYARAGGAGAGFQSLSVVAGEGGNSSGGEGNESVAPSGMPVPGIPPSVSTESVAVSGSSSATNMFGMSTDELRNRMQDYATSRVAPVDRAGRVARVVDLAAAVVAEASVVASSVAERSTRRLQLQ